MKRRDFLKMSSLATVACTVNGLPIHAYGQNNDLEKKTRNLGGKKLILIRLNGGNDGLNTLIPLDKYSELSSARADVLIPSSQVLPLNGLPATGLHPVMTHMQNLYNSGKMNIVQGVSYPNPNYSHFRASDIFASASDASLFLNSGWIGRFIENQFPGAPASYPNPSFTDPLSIEIGYQASSIIYGNSGLNGMTVSNIDYFYNIQNNVVDPAPPTKGGNELTYVRFIAQQTQSYTTKIQQATTAGTNSVTYPANNELADQLKIVAKLISGGLQTPVYIVTIDGFDTHSNQVEASNHAIGSHADLLAKLSSAIGAFQQDLENQSLDDDVVGMTFSEFGRRIIANASGGTDHGTSEPIFVFGTGVNPDMIGGNPTMPSVPTVNDDLPMQFDFRQVYATVLTDWFGVSQTSTNNIMNGSYFAWLPIFSANLPLPVNLTDFEVKTNQCDAVIQWQANSMEPFNEYEILYASDNKNFEIIGRVNTNGRGGNYSFNHQPKEGFAYYKLGMRNQDGQVVYTKVLSVNVQCMVVDVKVYPNPATDYLHIDIKGSLSPLSLTLITESGSIVKFAMNQNDNTILYTRDLPNGLYHLVVTNKSGHKEFHKVLVKHD